MIILTIDSATDTVCVSIYKDGDILCEMFLLRPRAQLKYLAGAIADTIKMSGIDKTEIDLIAVTNGPGSFTGLRLSLTAAKTIAQVLELKMAEVNTLDAIAFLLSPFSKFTVSALDARRNEIFACIYENTENGQVKISNYNAYSKEEFVNCLSELPSGEFIITGNALERYGEFIKSSVPCAKFASKNFWYPKGIAIAKIAEAICNENRVKNYADVSAFYMRKSEAEETREKKIAENKLSEIGNG